MVFLAGIIISSLTEVSQPLKLNMKRRRNGFQSSLASRQAFKRPRRTRPRIQGNRLSSLEKRVRVLTQAIEYKFLDTAVASNVIVTAGEIITASTHILVQGDGDSQREGRKVVVSSLFFRGSLTMPSQTNKDSTSDRIRLIVYVDKQANKAAPAILDILETADQDSFRNLTNTKRFRFLYDKTVAMNCLGGAGNGTADAWAESVKHLQMSFTDLNLPIQYTSTTGAITENTSNVIGMMGITQGGDAKIEGNWRCRYIDL